MNRLAHLVQKIADAHFDNQMDQTIRTAILEGFAGVPVGTWTRKGTAGIYIAQRALPDVSPEWFDRNKGFYAGAFVVALRKLQNKNEAADLVQTVMGGLTISSKGGELYLIGKRLAESGKADLGKAKAYLFTHLTQRTISENRDERHRNRESPLTHVDESGETVDMDIPAGRNDVVDVILNLATSQGKGSLQIYQILRKFFAKEWASAPNRLAIFDKIMEDPGLSDVGVARALGHGEKDPVPWIMLGAATMVSRIRRDIRDLMPQAVRESPEITKIVDLQEALADMGYGQGWKTAKLRAVLASFF